jgi:hypothetical protein
VRGPGGRVGGRPKQGRKAVSRISGRWGWTKEPLQKQKIIVLGIYTFCQACQMRCGTLHDVTSSLPAKCPLAAPCKSTSFHKNALRNRRGATDGHQIQEGNHGLDRT